MNRYIATITLATLLLASCGNGKRKEAKAEFPFPEIPAMVQDPMEQAAYASTRFWNRFFACYDKYYSPETLTAAFIKYASVTASMPVEVIAAAQDSLLAKASRAQAAHPDDSVYNRILTLCEECFYDPNSPLRNEECCIPYLQSIIDSPFTDDAAKAKARHELPLFSLNRPGQKASDFTYTLKNGRTGTLYSVKADRILLFFSNPGCHNCKEIIDALSTSARVQELISSGSLKVLNVYPDENLDEWYGYMSHYPDSWINAYDANLIIRADKIYYLRAIPSIYILDAEKRVVCKDATLETALQILNF